MKEKKEKCKFCGEEKDPKMYFCLGCMLKTWPCTVCGEPTPSLQGPMTIIYSRCAARRLK